MSNRTIEQEYTYIKAKFISLSRSIHLGYNTYDPLFTIAADAVRQAFNAEPIAEGQRRSQEHGNASHALIAIMRENTDISCERLYKMMLKKSHQTVIHNYKQHKALYQTCEYYRAKYDKALQIVKDTELCNT
jgi:hypothetical protein